MYCSFEGCLVKVTGDEYILERRKKKDVSLWMLGKQEYRMKRNHRIILRWRTTSASTLIFIKSALALEQTFQILMDLGKARSSSAIFQEAPAQRSESLTFSHSGVVPAAKRCNHHPVDRFRTTSLQLAQQKQRAMEAISLDQQKMQPDNSRWRPVNSIRRDICVDSKGRTRRMSCP